MDYLAPHCKREYLFQDDSLTINRQHTVDLCNELLKRKRKYRWAGYTRVDLVDKELLKIMAKAGCYSLTFGIETGDEKLRNEVVKKHFSNDQIKQTINWCNKFKINADGFFMFGHPTETEEQVQKTIDFVTQNKFNIIGVSIATPFPGSALWQHAIDDKIIDLDFIDEFTLGKKGNGYTGNYPVYIPKSLDRNWLYQQRKIIMRKFYLRPKYIIHRLLNDFSSLSKIKKDIVEASNLIIKGSSARSPYQKKYQ